MISSLLEDDVLKVAGQARVIYYYCSGSSPDSSRPRCESILRNFISQLAWRGDWTVEPLVQTAYSKHCINVRYNVSSKLSITAWKALLSELIATNNYDEGVIILVDGLDECEREDINTLLKVFKELVSNHPKLRLMLSSREHVEIATYFNTDHLTTILASAATTKHDMQNFIRVEIDSQENEDFNRESILRKKPELRKRLQEALDSRAQGMFQWVKIWIGILYPPDPIELSEDAEFHLKCIEGLASRKMTDDERWKRLNDAYSRLYLADSKNVMAQKYKNRVFRVLLSSFDLLDVSELVEAVTVDADETTRAEITCEWLQRRCCNFLIFEDSPGGRGSVKFAHESIKSFFVSSSSGEQLSMPDFSDVACHFEMTQLCFQVMAKKDHWVWRNSEMDMEALKEYWCREISRDKINKQVETIVRTKPLLGALLDHPELSEWMSRRGFAIYLSSYWIRHWNKVKAIPTCSHELYKPWDTILWDEVSAFPAWCVYLGRISSPVFSPQYFRMLETLDRCQVMLEAKDCVRVHGGVTYAFPTFAFFKWDVFMSSPAIIATVADITDDKIHESQPSHLSRHRVEQMCREVCDKNINGRTVLQQAIKDRRLDTIKSLLIFERLLRRQQTRGLDSRSMLLTESWLGPTTVFHEAVEEGSVEVLALLLRECHDSWTIGLLNLKNPRSISQDTRNSPSMTPLMLAAKTGNLDAIQAFTKTEGVDINVVDVEGDAALDFAARYGSVEVVRYLLQSEDIDMYRGRPLRQTALVEAIANGHGNVLELLLKDERTNLLDWPNESILDHASKVDSKSVFRAIRHSGKVDMSAPDANGQTVLIKAIDNHFVGNVQALLETNDVDVNFRDSAGRTPLIAATSCIEKLDNMTKIVVALLNTNKVDVNSRDQKGHTALWHAIWDYFKRSIFMYPNSLVIIRTLLKSDELDVDIKDASDESLVELAVRLSRQNILDPKTDLTWIEDLKGKSKVHGKPTDNDSSS